MRLFVIMKTPILQPEMKLLFIVNPGSGSDEVNFNTIITDYFINLTQHEAEIYELPPNCALDTLKGIINKSMADRVVAVGGDGTIKLVAESLLRSEIPIGIIPAGSANGMAKELGIPLAANDALEVAVNGSPKMIHAVSVNNELCIHLADIGFNAYLVKKFDTLPQRGMLGYAKAAWKALWSHRKMEVAFEISGKKIISEAAMVVIANATMYGTGVKINPEGRLDDELFEVVLVKKYAVMEILKLKFTSMSMNPQNIELFQTSSLSIKTKHPAHFQVDGEYLGKVRSVEAKLIINAIRIVA